MKVDKEDMMKRRNNGSQKWVVAFVVLAFSGGLANCVSAQPQQRQGGPDWGNMTPEQMQATLQDLPDDQQQAVQQILQFLTPQQQHQMLQNLPPDQREQLQQMFQQAQVWLQKRLQQQRRDWIRQTIIASGYKDAATQDAVIEFISTQEKARQPLREAAYNLTTILIDPAITEDEFKKQLGDFQDKIKHNEELYTKSLITLDENIKYSTQPRLKTLLTVLGVVGQETPSLGGLGAIFPDSPFSDLRSAA